MFLLTFCCSVVASGIAIVFQSALFPKTPGMQTTGDRGGLSVFLDICPLGTCTLNARDSRLAQLKHSRHTARTIWRVILAQKNYG